MGFGRRWSWMVAGVALGAGALSAPALTPDQIAIVVNNQSAASQQIATFYAKARNIPADHILQINIDPGEQTTEFLYRQRVQGVLRSALTQRKLADKITCLVTTYDVPLWVGPVKATPAQEREAADLRQQLNSTLEELQKNIAAYTTILAAPAATGPAAASAPAAGGAKPDLPKLLEQLHHAVDACAARLNKSEGAARIEAGRQFLQLHQRVLGLQGLATAMQPRGEGPEAQTQRAAQEAMLARVRQNQERMAELSRSFGDAKARQERRDLQLASHGLMGLIGQLEQDLAAVQQDQSEASLDNELMMLWIDDYPRARWLPNPYELTHWLSRADRSFRPKVLMVARLDGSTVQKATEMISTSIKTEQAGLDGAAYFDAQGLRRDDAYSAFDNDVRAAATYLRDNTTMKVVLEDTHNLLNARNAPECALYCGWYNLRNYQESCQWLPGSVGYHVASLELGSLHDPKETGWCVNMLNRGVSATLGAVGEPYLTAFPKPSEFFPLLVSGQYTLAEVYYLTTPMVSWRIALVGDPLYNPFKNKPRLTRAQLQAHPLLRHALTILPPGEATTTPATAPGTAPATLP